MRDDFQRRATDALLDAFERDMRLLLVDAFSEAAPETVLGPELSSQAQEACAKRGRPSDTLADLLRGVNLGDLFGLLDRHKSLLRQDVALQLSRFSPDQRKSVIDARNTIAHRDDPNWLEVHTVQSVTRSLAALADAWPQVAECVARLDRGDTGFLASIGLDLDAEAAQAWNNLPPPEHGDTGLIGRQRLLQQIKQRLLRGAHPVTTLYGIGGVGKTALAREVAGQLAGHNPPTFDAVVWVTAKSARLEGEDIVEIADALRTGAALIGAAADFFAGGEELGDPVATVLQYLEDFRILLVLDNLETAYDEFLTERFLPELRGDSRILITSRYGLGNAENRMEIPSLQPSEAEQLLRRSAELQGLQWLARENAGRVRDWVARMDHNPLSIKYFVIGAAAGYSPDQMLQRRGILLEYVCGNVYEHLTPGARTVLDTLVSAGGRRSSAEVAFLAEMGVDDTNFALRELRQTTFVRQVPGTGQVEVSPTAKEYLDTHQPPAAEVHERVMRRLASLAESRERGQAGTGFSRADVVWSSAEELVIAQHLREALEMATRGRHRDAADLVSDAARLGAADYAEVERVRGLVLAAAGNLTAAKRALERSTELDPRSGPAWYWRGRFLGRRLQLYREALDALGRAEECAPDEWRVQIERARCLAGLGKFQEAGKTLASVRGKGAPNREKSITALAVLLAHARETLAERKRQDAVQSLDAFRKWWDRVPDAAQYQRPVRLLHGYHELAREWELDATWVEARLVEVAKAEEAAARARAREDGRSFGRIVRCAAGDVYAFARVEGFDDDVYVHPRLFRGRPEIEVTVGDLLILDVDRRQGGGLRGKDIVRIDRRSLAIDDEDYPA
jgi:LuxR family transcriptional regulator, glucitol operon activator